MDLNERIEAGRNNDVAVSFRTAAEIQPVSQMDLASYIAYLDDRMKKQPHNSSLGREKILQGRRDKSSRHDVRIATAITKAAHQGANSLKELCKILNGVGVNSPSVPSRKGVEWNIAMASKEMVMMGISIKALHKYVHDPLHDLPQDKAIRLVAGASITTGEIELTARSKKMLTELQASGADRKRDRPVVVHIKSNMASDRPLTRLSEEAFWQIIEEEKLVAEKYGEWISILKQRPRSGDIVRHSDHGIGAFVDDESALLCRFWLENKETLLKVEPVKTDVFTWGTSIGKARREFARIRKKYAIDSAYVDASSVTREQRLARYRAVRWRV